MVAIGRHYSKGGITLRLNLTLGECSVIYTALKAELRYLNDMQSEEDWVIKRMSEINALIDKLDSI